MSISIGALGLPPKIRKYIIEGDEVVPFGTQENETMFTLVMMNHAEAMIREIWDTCRIGSRMRSHETKKGCYDGCKCPEKVSGGDEYFSRLYKKTVQAVEDTNRAEIEAMESQLGIKVNKIIIYESTETTLKIETDAGTFMMEPDKMFFAHDFAKTVFAKIQKIITISNKKVWPMLVMHWMKTKSERVRVHSQTNVGIMETELRQFISLGAVETTQIDAEFEIEKGNVAVVSHPTEPGNVYIMMRISDFMDFLDREKIKAAKNLVISALQEMGWNQNRLGRGRIRVWSKKTEENPLLSLPASQGAARPLGESMPLASL